MKLIAVHEIEYRAGKGRQFAQPGHLFEVDHQTGMTLKKMGAARDPSEAELALEAMKVKRKAGDQPRRARRRRDENPEKQESNDSGEGAESNDSDKDDDVV